MKIDIHAVDGLGVGPFFLSKEEALEVHQAVAKLGWCQDTDCPCYQHGAEAEREQSHE